MSILELDVVDSTSQEIRRRLDQGQRHPIAVFAHRQTQGRGQKDRIWQSPEGNLYLSFTLDSTDPRLSMAVALRLRELMYELTQVHCHIKWPNDLYMGGKKIAGILMEAVSDGCVIVGIGMNLTEAPLPASCSWKDFGITLSLNVLAQKIVAAMQALGSSGLVDGSHLQSIAQPGMPWKMLDGGWLKFKNICFSTPAFEFEDEKGENVALVSAQDMEAPLWKIHSKEYPLILADIGNTRTKFYVEGGGFFDPSKLPQVSVKHWPIFVSSVNSHRFEALQNDLSPRFKLHHVSKIPVFLNKSFYDLSQIGADRFFLLEAVCRRQLDPRGDLFSKKVIVLSCGTAVTVDYVDERRIHQGGYILPGLQSSLSALSSLTELPLVVPLPEDQEDAIWPQNSHEALSQGYVLALTSWIQSLKTQHNTQIVITGGDGTVLIESGIQATYVEHLVFEGMSHVLNVDSNPSAVRE